MPASELAKALAAVQADLPAIVKGETGEVKGVSKETGKAFSYTYRYADLADVSAAIMPLLGKNGLAFTAWPTLDDGRFVLVYALVHESGEERTGVYPLPSSGSAQQIGSAITYARRYCLCAVTGVAPGGEDDDAADATEVHMDRARPQTRPPSDVPTAARPVRAKGPGPEHEQIRHGTVEATPEDRPAERTRGPLPDNQNPWQDQPPEDQPGTADPKDIQKIQIAYTQKLGFERGDRDQMLNISGQIIGRPLDWGPNQGKTHNNLSHNEARKLRDTLQSFGGDRGLLMERLTGITQAVADQAGQAAEQAVAEADAAHQAAEDSQEAPK